MPVERCGIDGGPIVETDVDPLVGHRVDRYEIVESLGQGAMGVVYRARHTVLANERAIKVLYGNLALNQRLIERFRREAQAIGQMKHPNIVEVADFGESEGLTFLVMQLVQGRTLEVALEQDPPFGDERIARISRQIASGLGEAHRRGWVHRDMKPANVMLADVDGLEIVKILDFGVVGMIQQAVMQKLTIAGHIVGTPNYMAPEQARSSSVGPAADLYALGIIMYEMLARRPPFEGLGVAEVLLKQINEPPPPIRPDANPGLAKLTRWLLEKKSESRPANAARVIAEIDRLNLDVASTEQIAVSSLKKAMPRVLELENAKLRSPSDAETDNHAKDKLRSGLRVAMIEEIQTGDLSPPSGSEIPSSQDITEAGQAVEPTILTMPTVSSPGGSPVTQPVPAPMLVPLTIPPLPSDPLVAPYLVGPPELPPPMTTSRDGDLDTARSQLDGPTQLDFRAVQRPKIGVTHAKSDLIASSSNADTAPPERVSERPRVFDMPRDLPLPAAEFIRTERELDSDPAELMRRDVLQGDTVPVGAHIASIREAPALPPASAPFMQVPLISEVPADGDLTTRRLFWLVILLAVGCGLLVAAILKRTVFN